jgi:hypothetical protein
MLPACEDIKNRQSLECLKTAHATWLKEFFVEAGLKVN